MTRPTLSLQLPSYASYGSWLSDDWSRLLDLARAAEDAGVHRIVYVDHVTMGRNPQQYAWGSFQIPSEAPWLECLTTLTALAAVTRTVRLSTRILIAPLRPAALLAKTVATIDVLSGGRVDLGVGTGWQREEFEAQALDFDARGQLLTDTIGACRQLWSQLPASFESPTTSFSDVFCAPLPAQPRLPVWFGGVLHARNLRRIRELGDGWIPIMTASVEDVAAGAAVLRSEPSRSPLGAYEISAPAIVGVGPDRMPDIARTMESAPKLIDAGATDVFFSLGALCRDPERAPEAITEIVERFEQSTS
jgi:probable F420-dependent oxidoreductase